jgi:plasmid stability protein
MRTTLTLDDNLIRTLKKRAAEQNVSFKVMVHQALQKGLESMDRKPKSKGAYRTPVRSLKPRAGLDLDTLGRTADDQGDEELLRHLS